MRNRFARRMIVAVALVTIVVIALILPRHSKPLPIVPPEVRRATELVLAEGHWYRIGATNPFIGWMEDYYPGGTLWSRCQISNGLLNGLSEIWYTNGQISVRENFRNGVSNGERAKWHENGNVLSRAEIIDGRVTGTFRSWYANGQLSEQIEMKAGQADGLARAFYPSGFLKAETKVKDGRILGRTSWQDGENAGPPRGS